MGVHNNGDGEGIRWLKAHVAYEGNDCLPWPFSKDGRVGRGRLGYKGKLYWAHRLMCILAHGEPPTPKHQAAHSCGKGHYACCNPRHLSWKTNSENQLDRRKNGNMLRNPHGNQGALDQAQIDQIIALKDQMTQVAIAAKFGVSLGCVQYWHKVREQRQAKKAPIDQRIDEALAGAPMALNDLAVKMYGRLTGKSTLVQWLSRKNFNVVDGIVYPRQDDSR